MRCLLALMLLISPAAMAGDQPVYAGGDFIFAFFREQDEFTSPVQAGTLFLADEVVEVVVGATARLGYGFEAATGLPVRAELRYTYRYHYDFDLRLGVAGIGDPLSWDNTVTQHAITADLYYDFRAPTDRIRPYLGGALGYGFTRVETERTDWLANSVTRAENDLGALVWNLAIGARWQFAPGWQLDGSYRFGNAGEIESAKLAGGEIIGADGIQTHDLTLGLLYSF